ncbi:MAG: methyl-accepting chemotaxis protein [Gammaproteobacteria bacterium]|nr:methyl-accepting chemotaxis protein [Gammaproteobacteria bacterium]
MRINEPVTNIEHTMKDGVILVSKTNLRGIVTEANQAFMDIAMMDEADMIGKNHNVVRHPDMPPEAFEDLWNTVKEGRPWLGYVKNRCKNGDFYWVEANVSPVFKNGQVVEYLSVRSKPSAVGVDAATQLYQKIRAGKATLTPSGLFSKIKKSVRDFSIRKSLAILLTLPAIVAWTLAYFEGNLNDPVALISDGIVTALLLFIYIWIDKSVIKNIDLASESLMRMSEENFSDQYDITRNDEVGKLFQFMKTMQNNQRANIARDREQMAVNFRIKQALDNVNSNVMLADPNLNIIYTNHAVLKMFKNSEKAIQKDLPNFNVDTLLGTCIDVFHKDPSHQRRLLGGLTSMYSSALQVGGRDFSVIANPVMSESGDRLGTVIEWADRTNEIAVEKEIAAIVDSAKNGDLDQRLDTGGKEGFFLLLCDGINEMVSTISASFSDVARVMRAMADGDLTQKITADYNGTYADVQNDINATIDKFEEVVGQIIESSEFFKNTSEEIASGNNNLSQRAEEQASTLEETASSMEELTGTVKNNADNAQQANQLAASARATAEKGGDVVKEAVVAMDEINSSSTKIAEIIGVIDEIAFQTNLLALNASVEAARAGEQGRGFAVVATEVRNLAGRSATAAKEIKDLITDSAEKVKNGSQLVNESGETLSEIVAGVKKVGDIISEIAAASSEQSAGIDQINKAVSQMDEMTQQNAALAEEASAASESSVSKAVDMVKLVEFFRTNNSSTRSSSSVSHSDHSPASSKPAPAAEKKRPGSRKPAPRTVVDEEDEWEDF